MPTNDYSPEQAYEHFLTVARYEPEAVVPFRADAHLVQHNALVGLEAVLQQTARVEAELPTVKMQDILDIRPLTHAVVHAAARVNRTPEASQLSDLLPRAYGLRRKMMLSLRALSEAGLIPEREVKLIEKGKGKVDAAGDLPQAAALFRRHAATIRGKHPVSEEELKEADRVGAQLLELLRPGGARTGTPASQEVEASVDARDRLWTLLEERHDLMWRVGAWLFGNEVERKVPPLQSRKVTRGAPQDPADPADPVA